MLVSLSTLFAVLGDPGNGVLADAVAATFPGDYIEIRPGQWFVASTGTAKEISDKLGVTPGTAVGSAIVVSASGYYGRANSQIWEWVAAKIGKPANA